METDKIHFFCHMYDDTNSVSKEAFTMLTSCIWQKYKFHLPYLLALYLSQSAIRNIRF